MRLVFCLGLTWVLALSLRASATTVVAPVTLTLAQPDGFAFQAVAKGDSKRHWTQTLSGHSIVKIGDTWFFAEGVVQSGRGLKASRIAVSEQTISSPPAESLRLSPTKNSASYEATISDSGQARFSGGSGGEVVMEPPRGDNSHRNYDGFFQDESAPIPTRAHPALSRRTSRKRFW